MQAVQILRAGNGIVANQRFASRYPPPLVSNEAEAKKARDALKSLANQNMERFDKLFLRSKAVFARREELNELKILERAGYLRIHFGWLVKPCLRVFILDRLFIATDLLTQVREDQVFSLMMEQVLLVRTMDVCKGDHVLELCLGSGINAIYAASRGAARVCGVDVSQRALVFARCNALVNLQPAQNATFETFRGDLFSPLQSSDQFDLVLLNPPFELVPSGESYFLHSHGGEDGLDVIRRFLPDLKRHMRAGGRFEMFTWAPGNEKDEWVSPLVAAALPGYRVEVIQADCRSLDDRIATFKEKPGFQEFRGRLIARGITHVWGVHIRAVESTDPKIVRVEAADLVEACFGIASEWSDT